MCYLSWLRLSFSSPQTLFGHCWCCKQKKTKKYTNHELKLNLLATNRLSLNVSSERDSMNLCRICHLSDYQCVRRNSTIFHSESHNEQRAISCYDSSELDFHLVRIAHIENASGNRIEKHEFRQNIPQHVFCSPLIDQYRLQENKVCQNFNLWKLCNLFSFVFFCLGSVFPDTFSDLIGFLELIGESVFASQFAANK